MDQRARTITDVDGNVYPLRNVVCCNSLPTLPLDSASSCPVCGERTFATED